MSDPGKAPRPTARHRLPLLPYHLSLLALGLGGLATMAVAAILSLHWLGDALRVSAFLSLAATASLVLKSVRDFTQTGPQLQDTILRRYRGYVVFAVTRLAGVAYLLCAFWCFPGAVLWLALDDILGWNLPFETAILGAALSLGCATLYAACHALASNPGLIIASWAYRPERIHRLWQSLSPQGLRATASVLALLALLGIAVIALLRALQGSPEEGLALWLATLGYIAILVVAIWEPEATSVAGSNGAKRRNILMIGSDTLRADRIGATRDGNPLTPNINGLAQRGNLFTNCYVPCARTAPSLVSLLTGTWPHHHGIRDNFVADEDTHLPLPTLPWALRNLGYRTAAISDWCGADLGKFPLGFEHLDLPEDQWNLKYLIRQGPKDLRLFLSLFLHNRIGRHLLPEVYYLGGVPQTNQLGIRARRTLARLVKSREPFLLNVFYSTTHPPFASESPYFLRYAAQDYDGPSKFAMARLTDPFEIIRRQGEPRSEFDLDQILALYDGCVAHFDDEVGKWMDHLSACGIAEDTLVVLYSDHGMEFFEHGSWGQGNSAVGDFSARIPLLISDPRSPCRGRPIPQVVRSIDVAPTLLDLVDAPPIACDGVSLRPLLEDRPLAVSLVAYNETGMWLTRVPGLPAEHLGYPPLPDLLDVPDDGTGTLALRPEFRDVVVRAKDRMIRQGRWKLVFQPLEGSHRIALFDVEADPGCTRDLSATHPEVVSALQTQLCAWLDADRACAGLGAITATSARPLPTP